MSTRAARPTKRFSSSLKTVSMEPVKSTLRVLRPKGFCAEAPISMPCPTQWCCALLETANARLGGYSRLITARIASGSPVRLMSFFTRRNTRTPRNRQFAV
jgi:hypothetical protein